jgi:hypothetical protein
MWRAVLFSLLLAPHIGATCQCVIRFGVCDEVQQSDAVFIGTVESVAPPFMDPYARAKGMVSIPAAEAARLQGDSSPEGLEKLRALYLRMFSGIPETVRSQIVNAQTQHELQTAFEAVQSEGRVARFRVRTLYKRESDDDDAKKPANSAASAAAKKDDDDDHTPEFLDVWTGSGDCGFDFQVGETYLVYAVEDEASGKLETSVCMRTRRISEEQGDMSFLYFLKNAGKESARLEGFVSTSFADQNTPRYENSVTAPSPGALLELDTGSGTRYTQADREGRFAFDGLKAGDYRLSLLAPGFPQKPRTVILSRGFHANAGECARQILILPTPH